MPFTSRRNTVVGRLQFDPQALYDAVDAERRARGLTWTALSRELRISTSTIKSMPKRRWGIELDGVIGLARWLGRTVESFAGGDGGPSPAPTSWRSGGYMRRFETKALYRAVDAERERRAMTWDQVADEVWPKGPWTSTQLKQLANGGRGEVYNALAICEWLGRTIQEFEHDAPF